MTELERAVAAVLRAIDDEGPRPDVHRDVGARHRREWPTLWRALDELRRAGPPPDLMADRMRALLPSVRALAMEGGTLHSAWDVIGDAEAYLTGRRTIVAPGVIVEMMERLVSRATPTRTGEG
jgi:hypothetical protein